MLLHALKIKLYLSLEFDWFCSIRVVKTKCRFLDLINNKVNDAGRCVKFTTCNHASQKAPIFREEELKY